MQQNPSADMSSMRLGPVKATIKAQPEDWRVDERLGWGFTGSGEHRYLYIEKRNMNTTAVAAELVQRYSVRPQDVGYAGLKDKRAITRQWFSVTTPDDSIDHELARPVSHGEDQYYRCLESARHLRKLRRGEHQRNDFTVRLGGDLDLAVPLLAQLAQPFVNYFGPQRFGGDNLAAAKRWLVDRRPRRVNKVRRVISVCRAELFIQPHRCRTRTAGVREHRCVGRSIRTVSGLALGSWSLAFHWSGVGDRKCSCAARARAMSWIGDGRRRSRSAATACAALQL